MRLNSSSSIQCCCVCAPPHEKTSSAVSYLRRHQTTLEMPAKITFFPTSSPCLAIVGCDTALTCHTCANMCSAWRPVFRKICVASLIASVKPDLEMLPIYYSFSAGKQSVVRLQRTVKKTFDIYFYILYVARV